MTMTETIYKAIGINSFAAQLRDHEAERAGLIAKADASIARRAELEKAESDCKMTGDLDQFQQATAALRRFENSTEARLPQFVAERVAVIDSRIAEIKAILRQDEIKEDREICAALSDEAVEAAHRMAAINAKCAQLYGAMQSKYPGRELHENFQPLGFFGIAVEDLFDMWAKEQRRFWHAPDAPPIAPVPVVVRAVKPLVTPKESVPPAPRAKRAPPPEPVPNGRAIYFIRPGIEREGWTSLAGDRLVVSAADAAALVESGAADFEKENV